jgi:hypothetical protein
MKRLALVAVLLVGCASAVHVPAPEVARVQALADRIKPGWRVEVWPPRALARPRASRHDGGGLPQDLPPGPSSRRDGVRPHPGRRVLGALRRRSRSASVSRKSPRRP